MSKKPKRPGYDLKAADRRRNLAIQIGMTAIVVLFAVALVGYIVISNSAKPSDGQPIRVASPQVVTADDSDDPKAVVAVYEDFLCPACANFEHNFGKTLDKLVDIGAIAVDYHPSNILSKRGRDNYSGRAGAAAYCVADESMEAFERFHAMLFSPDLQPLETAATFPDNARLIELARQAGAAGTVRDCVNSGKYLKLVDGMAAAGKIEGTPTIRINGEDYSPKDPAALVKEIRGIVGDVPGIDEAAAVAAAAGNKQS
ncbi:DsbA family protein [Mycobacterium sp. 1274756.6]|uniref:DsbA family protein n=1 Tax=Mycobacterium sp. 1274756.6 TaxID=1834076 RepID=UPI0007FDB6E1|nr:DsbA family protein [Mycobacterium sp. 1274756.6]OBJ70422.1 hypothetical protein A5643_10495 [Mycobacterium sp. 1274756.6]